MTSTTTRSERLDGFTLACIIAHALLGFVLSGIGAVLPDLRDSLGAVGSVYPSLPGFALLVTGLYALRHEQDERRAHHDVVRWASAALALSVGLTVITGFTPVSVVGAVAMAVNTAILIRLLPAALTAHQPERSAPLITAANAWGSTAGITAPLLVGLATAVGLGWRTGWVAPIAALALVIVVLTARSHGSADAGYPGGDEHHDPDGPEPPWFDAWLALTLSILVEFSFAFFAATYLREEVNMSSAGSAAGAAAFAIGMTGARFLATPVKWFGALAPQVHMVPLAAGFVLMWAVPKPVTAIAGFFLAGVGIALMYPTGIRRLMRRFPDSLERGAARGGLASGAALVAAPTLLGVLRGLSDVRTAYLAVPVLIAALFLTLQWAARNERSLTR